MASIASIPLQLLLTLKDQATAALEKAGGGLGLLKTAALGVGGAAIAGVGALTAGLISAGKAAAEEEVGVAKLAAAVKASGADWGVAEEAIEAYLEAELRRTALDDGEGREAISRLVTATGDYAESLELMGLVQDLAVAKDMSLANAAEIVGKVASGNVSVLTRYGITLEEGTTATEALGIMQQRFAGQAEEYGNTNAGAQQKLDIAMGNLKETVGGLVLPIMSQFAVVLADLAMRAMPIVQGAIEAAQPIFAAVFGWIRDNVVPILSAIVGYVVDNWPAILATVMAVINSMWDLIQLVLGALMTFWTENHDKIMSVIEVAWEYVKTTVENVIKIVKGIIETVTAAISGDWEGVWEGIQKIFGGVWDQIQNIAETVTGLVKGIFDVFGVDVGAIWDGIYTKAQTIWETIKTAIVTPISDAWDSIKRIVDSIMSAFGSIKFPHIPLPHFEVNWKEILGVRIPTGVSVNWYGQGLDAVFDRPTLIGVGEAGAERVTVSPLGGGGGGGTKYSLTYIDQRANGGAPDLITIARGLEWRARMRA